MSFTDLLFHTSVESKVTAAVSVALDQSLLLVIAATFAHCSSHLLVKAWWYLDVTVEFLLINISLFYQLL